MKQPSQEVIRIGVFFGGPSREREISFAGGKTAFEHLDQQLFSPVPIFVDGLGRFILLNPAHMYAPHIRAFYPESTDGAPSRLYIESFPERACQPIPPEIGTQIEPSSFGAYFDFAFLAMHGPDCEDGSIQGLLEWYKIPYSGPGLLGSSVGIDKILQNHMLGTVIGQVKKTALITFDEWSNAAAREAIFNRIKKDTGLPVVIKAPHQGSSIGVAIVKDDDLAAFSNGVNQCFFVVPVASAVWGSLSPTEKEDWAYAQSNLESGVGYPLYIENRIVYHPDELIAQLDQLLKTEKEIQLISADFEPIVLCEEFVSGQEFSCGCIQNDAGEYLALPPTEVIKVEEVFDFNSKYKAGGTRKRIPVQSSLENNLKIQNYVAKAAKNLGMDVCVRIDGFLTSEGEVILHDPNTVPGMSPTSLIFKQMAEIGLNITQSLTYLIRQSLVARVKTGKDTYKIRQLVGRLEERMARAAVARDSVRAVVIDAENAAYARAKKWYAQLSARGTSKPVVYLRMNNEKLYELPPALLSKDFVEEVVAALQTATDPLIKITQTTCREITTRYAGKVDGQHSPISPQQLPAEIVDTEFDKLL